MAGKRIPRCARNDSRARSLHSRRIPGTWNSALFSSLLLAATLLAAACGGSAPKATRAPTATPVAGPTATPTAVAAGAIPSSAALNPKRINTNPGHSVAITVEAGEVADAVQQVVVELAFDPKALVIESVTRGKFLDTPKLASQDIDNRNGKGTFTFSTAKPSTPTRAGQIATLSVRAQQDIAATGEYTLTLKRVTFIYDDGRQLTTDPANAIVAVTLLPTPTPSAAATPKATP